MNIATALDLPIPRNQTALMQHLLRLVGVEGHLYYASASCRISKLAGFVQKMEHRYPLMRTARQRCYDRERGRAAVHLVIYPLLPFPYSFSRASGVYSLGDATAYNRRLVEELSRYGKDAQVVWWLVSGRGSGGLLDPSTDDHRVSQDAMSASTHISFNDYVLHYAHKKEAVKISDRRTGRTRTVLKDASSWTWSLNKGVIAEVKATIRACCSQLDFGAPPHGDRPGHGLQGLLHAQRRRPLFSGVRTDVLELEKYARELWRSLAPRWRTQHSGTTAELGKAAGELPSLSELLRTQMPKMMYRRIYNDPPLRVRDLLPDPEAHVSIGDAKARTADVESTP
jgi:hypothetical protein